MVRKTTAARKKQPAVKNPGQNHCPVPGSVLIAIGGAENKGEDQPENKHKPGNFIKLEVLQRMKDYTHKREPVIEVVTTASGEPSESFKAYQKVFSELGFGQVNQIHHDTRREVLADALLERLAVADVFFFTGGDQLKLTSIYGGTQFLTTLKERYIHDQIVIAGTSAGAMALSTPMIYAGNKEIEELAGEIKVTMGLEFLKDVCIDTHFVHRGRFVRIAQVIATNPTSIGVGIEEDTALIVRNGAEAEVVGTGLVIIIEGFQIAEANIEDFGKEKPVGIRDLRVHILRGGDTYQIPEINPPHK